ncbi:hypothetical protein QUF76_09990 [Desulfobacterales bacterium HSG16]|nr:hypothetical protein [Desulfobacterales bacterium HSG16]
MKENGRIFRLLSTESTRKFNGGWTMIEVIAILVILSIIGAMSTRYNLSFDSNTAAETDIIKSHLRFARYMSLSNDEYSWKITFISGTPSLYTLVKVKKDDFTEKTVNLPGYDSQTRTLADNVSIVSGETVIFDKWGSPGDKTQTIELSSGKGKVVITKKTGFIP